MTTSGTAHRGICLVKIAEPVVVKSKLFTTEKIWGFPQNDPNELLVKEAGLSPNQKVVTSKIWSLRITFVGEHTIHQNEVDQSFPIGRRPTG